MFSKNRPIKKSLLEMAVMEQFIPGICNFCDRWCERCSMTRNCLSFANGQEIKGINIEQNNNDDWNKIYWDAIQKSLESGFALTVKNVETIQNDKFLISDLVDFANHYGTTVNNWLTTNAELFDAKSDQILIKIKEKEVITITDGIDIIKWYSFFIATKIQRSLKDISARKNQDIEDKHNPYRDNIGSAKIAIIACEHSMAAFSLLHPYLEQHQNEILLFFTDLLIIKNQILEIFPLVMQFKRPAFDK